jgi:hypothetical protein
MLKIKIILLSIKIKIINIFYKNYDPFEQNDKAYFLSPSHYIKDFSREVKNKINNKENIENNRLKLKELLNINKNNNYLNVLNVENFSIRDDLNRKKIYFKYSKFRDFPVNIITKKNLKNPKAIIICLQGANSGAHLNYDKVILPNDHFKIKLGSGHAIKASENNYIGVSYERIGYGERREKNIKTKYNNVSTYNLDPSLSFLLYGKTLLGESVNELNSLINFLKNEYGNLPLYVVGYSDGGALALSLAAINNTIDGIAISGCIGLFEDTILKRTQSGLLNIPKFLNYFNMNNLLDLVHPRYCLIISGNEDHIWPFKLTKKVFDKTIKTFANQKNKLNFKLIQVNGGHTYYPEIMWQNLNEEINKYEKR